MKTVGIIAEYNPFHNGHAYQISEAKRITGADCAVIIMSGDFVQRGEPAIMDKYLRTEAALQGGADIIFELPVHFATASSEYFAMGAVKLLNKLGTVDYLCFGSECGDIDALTRLAEFLCNEPDEYSEIIQKHIKSGLSYPAARAAALKEYTEKDASRTLHTEQFMSRRRLSPEDISLLDSPNNILAVEYIKALIRIKSDMVPVTIKRSGNMYHDTNLAFGILPSASALRLARNIEELREYMPDAAYNAISKQYNVTWPIVSDDLTPLLHYKILLETNSSLAEYRDVGIELANSIKNTSDKLCTFSELAESLNSKKYTAAKLSRALLHIVLSDKESDTNKYHFPDCIPYIRLLGFKRNATAWLRELNDRHPDFVITKLANARKQLSPEAFEMFNYDLNAYKLYSQLIYNKYNIVRLPEASLKLFRSPSL